MRARGGGEGESERWVGERSDNRERDGEGKDHRVILQACK